MSIQRFEDLEVWKAAHRAVLETYKMTRGFPSEERFALALQMRRCAYSVASNICEGFGRRRPKDKIHFYNYSESSIEELRYFVILSRDLGYVKESGEIRILLDSTARMLKRLVQSVEATMA